MHLRSTLLGATICVALFTAACAQGHDDGTAGDADFTKPVDAGGGGDDTGSVDDTGDPGVDAGTADDAGFVDESVPTDDTGSIDDTTAVTDDTGATYPDAGTLDGAADAGGAVDTGRVDAGPADTGPMCTGTLVACGGGCVNTQTDGANCGACGHACVGSQTWAGGTCVLNCAAPTVACGTACANTQTDVAHCGACDTACTTGQWCLGGHCAGGPLGGTAFQVSLSASACNAVDHGTVTGGDRGGIAVSSARAFYTGVTSTGRFDLNTLLGETVGRVYDSLVSDLATGTVYSLGNGATPVGNTGGMVTSLIALDATTGGLTSTVINLTTPIMLSPGAVGIFSGYGRIVLMGGGRAWHVSLPTGAVLDLGPIPLPGARVACNSWAIWGVAEYYGGALYVDYVQSATAIARMRIPDGTVSTLATFTNLANMCGFTVSPVWRRWYFHHQGPSQFRNASGQTMGYCDATITGPTGLPCRPIEGTCGGSCTDLQTNTANCGACGHACAGSEACVGGSCVLACPTGQTACAGHCVDTTSDTANCGVCGHACTGTQYCAAGACGGGANYAVDTNAAGVTWVDACAAAGSMHVLSGADDSGGTIGLPFATRWWGAAIAAGTSIGISSNGNLQVGATSANTAFSGSIPSTATPNGVIALQWADLVMSSTGVCIATTGTAPARRFLVEYAHATTYLGGTEDLNFEVSIAEGSGIIEFAYNTMSLSATATVGLENATGSAAAGGCPGGSTSCTVPSGRHVRFTPAP